MSALVKIMRANKLAASFILLAMMTQLTSAGSGGSGSITITSPSNGFVYTPNTAITFSWDGSSSQSRKNVYYKFDSGSWVSTSLDGSVSRSFSSGTHTFKVKLREYVCFQMVLCDWVETIDSVTVKEPDAGISIGTLNELDFKTVDSINVPITVGSASDSVKIYTLSTTNTYTLRATYTAGVHYTKGSTFNFPLNYMYLAGGLNSPHYSQALKVENIYKGSVVKTDIEGFTSKWNKIGSLNIKTSSYYESHNDAGVEELYFMFGGTCTNVQNAYTAGSTQHVVRDIGTMSNVGRGSTVNVDFYEDDGGQCYNYYDEELFFADLVFNKALPVENDLSLSFTTGQIGTGKSDTEAYFSWTEDDSFGTAWFIITIEISNLAVR